MKPPVSFQESSLKKEYFQTQEYSKSLYRFVSSRKFLTKKQKLEILANKIESCPHMAWGNLFCSSCENQLSKKPFKLSCLSNFCKNHECIENRRRIRSMKFKDFHIRSKKIYSFVIGFEPVNRKEISKELIKKYHTIFKSILKKVQKTYGKFYYLSVRDINLSSDKSGNVRIHYHIATLPLKDFRFFVSCLKTATYIGNIEMFFLQNNYVSKISQNFRFFVSCLKTATYIGNNEMFFLQNNYVSKISQINKFAKSLCDDEFSTMMTKLKDYSCVAYSLSGYKKTSATLNYFSKRAIGVFGHNRKDESKFGYSDFLNLEQYFDCFHGTKTFNSNFKFRERKRAEFILSLNNIPKKCPHCEVPTYKNIYFQPLPEPPPPPPDKNSQKLNETAPLCIDIIKIK